MDKRHRDEDGQIRHKRRDTLVRTLRDEYGADFVKGHRADATLGTVLDEESAATLSELLNKKK